jgi:hypothetical protein
MVKKTITFLDFEGKEVTKDFYFNLSKMEFRVLDRKIPGGLQNMIDQIMKEKDEDRLIDLLDTLILESYGEKSEDGRFVKEDRVGRRLSSFFKISEAWDVLFMNLVSDEKELHDFLMGIVPKDVAEKAAEESNRLEVTLTPATDNVTQMPKK